MEINATMIKELRERTGAGMSDCKKALTEVDGDLEKASEYLRKKGLAAAAKKAGRIATEGHRHVIHPRRSRGRAARGQLRDGLRRARPTTSRTFVKDVAMHIAGASPVPMYVSDDQIDPAIIEAKEREVRAEAAQATRRPTRATSRSRPVARRDDPEGGRRSDRQVEEGHLPAWTRSWVRDPDDGKKTIGMLLNELVAKIGENVKIRRFVRWELGEGLEKKKRGLRRRSREAGRPLLARFTASRSERSAPSGPLRFFLAERIPRAHAFFSQRTPASLEADLQCAPRKSPIVPSASCPRSTRPRPHPCALPRFSSSDPLGAPYVRREACNPSPTVQIQKDSW